MKGKRISTGCMVMLLSACGGGAPSEGDVRDAVEAHYETAMQAMADMLGNSDEMQKQIDDMMPDYSEIKLIGCKERESAPGYACDVELELPIVGRQTVPMQLVKTDGEWRLLGGL